MSGLIKKTTLSIASISLFALLFVGSGGGSGDCWICDGTGENDCAICVNGYNDGRMCTFCNGNGESTCTF